MSDKLPALGHFVHGKTVPATSGRSQAVFNPATGAAIAEDHRLPIERKAEA